MFLFVQTREVNLWKTSRLILRFNSKMSRIDVELHFSFLGWNFDFKRRKIVFFLIHGMKILSVEEGDEFDSSPPPSGYLLFWFRLPCFLQITRINKAAEWELLVSPLFSCVNRQGWHPRTDDKNIWGQFLRKDVHNDQYFRNLISEVGFRWMYN